MRLCQDLNSMKADGIEIVLVRLCDSDIRIGKSRRQTGSLFTRLDEVLVCGGYLREQLRIVGMDHDLDRPFSKASNPKGHRPLLEGLSKGIPQGLKFRSNCGEITKWDP